MAFLVPNREIFLTPITWRNKRFFKGARDFARPVSSHRERSLHTDRRAAVRVVVRLVFELAVAEAEIALVKLDVVGAHPGDDTLFSCRGSRFDRLDKPAADRPSSGLGPAAQRIARHFPCPRRVKPQA